MHNNYSKYFVVLFFSVKVSSLLCGRENKWIIRVWITFGSQASRFRHHEGPSFDCVRGISVIYTYTHAFNNYSLILNIFYWSLRDINECVQKVGTAMRPKEGRFTAD